MKRPRDKLFASAAFARDHHRYIVRRGAPHAHANLVHRARPVAHDAVLALEALADSLPPRRDNLLRAA